MVRSVRLMSDPLLRGTKESVPCHIWMSEAGLAAIREGVSGDFVRVPAIRERMLRAYAAGEAIWMAADAVVQFWLGAARAARESDDGIAVIRAAAAKGVLR